MSYRIHDIRTALYSKREGTRTANDTPLVVVADVRAPTKFNRQAIDGNALGDQCVAGERHRRPIVVDAVSRDIDCASEGPSSAYREQSRGKCQAG